MSVYTDNGYLNRADYLDALYEQYGDIVYDMADLLGPDEDFDALVTFLEDYADDC